MTIRKQSLRDNPMIRYHENTQQLTGENLTQKRDFTQSCCYAYLLKSHFLMGASSPYWISTYATKHSLNGTYPSGCFRCIYKALIVNIKNLSFIIFSLSLCLNYEKNQTLWVKTIRENVNIT